MAVNFFSRSVAVSVVAVSVYGRYDLLPFKQSGWFRDNVIWNRPASACYVNAPDEYSG